MSKPLLALIARKNHGYSIRRWNEEAEKRGAAVELFDTKDVQLAADTKTGSVVLKDGRSFTKKIDGVYRVLTNKPAMMVQNHFVSRGARTFREPSYHAVRSVDYKFHMYARMAEGGTPVPKSFFLTFESMIDDCIEFFGGEFPLIVKVESTKVSHHGIGVILAESASSLKAITSCFLELGIPVMVQEFIKEEAGLDHRAIVLDGKVIAAAGRDNRKSGDFRSNLHQGGEAIEVKLTKAQEKAAIAAAKSLGVVFGGVDLLGSPKKPVVTEVNAPCDYSYVEKATGANIVGPMIDYLLKK